MVLNVLAAVSQRERETIGERTAEAMAYKRRWREYTGSEPPYGWELAADGIHLEVCPWTWQELVGDRYWLQGEPHYWD
jgi:hypothetical protein